ncbi:MAG: hypothetical protein HRT90_10125 [Candidatus Margulisbacteria bacterium]|nr:hypothetical protein [Candidatus Margulisiibacteriota bacterium]
MKKKYSKSEAEKLLPFIREFNKVAKDFIHLLNHQVEAKEKRIKVLVDGISLPKTSRQVDVRAVDPRKYMTKKKKGSLPGSYDTEKLKEQYLNDLKRRLII